MSAGTQFNVHQSESVYLGVSLPVPPAVSREQTQSIITRLGYALRAKSIQNKPTLNVSMTKEQYVKELQV